MVDEWRDEFVDIHKVGEWMGGQTEFLPPKEEMTVENRLSE